MTSLLLVRHGRTSAVGRYLSGQTPHVSLDQTGRAQAEALGTFLAAAALRAVYASPLERTLETARAIARPHGLEVETRESLLDIDFGAWTGKDLVELDRQAAFQRFNAQRAAHAPPGGEHPVRVQCRMALELCRLRDEHPGELVAIVGHLDPLRSAIAYFLGVPLDLARRLELDPGSVTRLELTHDDAKLIYLNRDPSGGP